MTKLDIGLKQGKILCQMQHDERLNFLAEGLPIILESARGLWIASQELKSMPREAAILKQHAEEEAAKILIVMDIVRCPKKVCPSKMSAMVKWFYSHMARIIYAEAVSWKPMHLNQLRDYVDNTRQTHYLEGDYGEYILPNWEISSRERKLYADIETQEGGERRWNAPSGNPRLISSFTPSALMVAETLSALGIFHPEGLRVVAEIWDTIEFKDMQNFGDSKHLTEQLLKQIINEGLVTDAAKQCHISRIYDSWQMPMYNLDFSLIPVSLDELQKERDALSCC